MTLNLLTSVRYLSPRLRNQFDSKKTGWIVHRTVWTVRSSIERISMQIVVKLIAVSYWRIKNEINWKWLARMDSFTISLALQRLPLVWQFSGLATSITSKVDSILSRRRVHFVWFQALFYLISTNPSWRGRWRATKTVKLFQLARHNDDVALCDVFHPGGDHISQDWKSKAR